MSRRDRFDSDFLSIYTEEAGSYASAFLEQPYFTYFHHKKLGFVMNHAIKRSSVEDCLRIKDLGYGSSNHIRLYGQQFEIVSDPIPDGDGVSVQVTSSAEPAKRTLRLPTSILVGFKDFFSKVV